MSNDHVARSYAQPITNGHLAAYSQPTGSGQAAYMYPQQMYGNQMGGYGYGYGYGYSQGEHQNGQFLEQRMSGLSVRDDGALRNSSYSVPVPSGRPSKPEDKLFGDLVDISKFKPKTTPGRTGSV